MTLTEAPGTRRPWYGQWREVVCSKTQVIGRAQGRQQRLAPLGPWARQASEIRVRKPLEGPECQHSLTLGSGRM